MYERPLHAALPLILVATASTPLFGQDTATSAVSSPGAEETAGLLPIPDYSGDWLTRTKLTGSWGDMRQEWADGGFTFDLDWYQSYQDITDGGVKEGSESSTNIDYRMKFDLMRMDVVPGALVTVRAQSRFGDTVNGNSGHLLPVNSYSSVPFSTDSDGDVDIAVTELNWLQLLSENFGVLAGKITTMTTSNEFMGGEGRTQFMNFQLMFPSVVAHVVPYSTLAVGAFWMPNPNVTLSTTVMNLEDASTTSGFDDIGDGATWATNLDYRYELDELPGGGGLGFIYGFDGDFNRIGGLFLTPDAEFGLDNKSTAWALAWSGWQYLTTEHDTAPIDPSNGRQDRQGLGVFLGLGLGDEDTNPTTWSIAGGLSGRGSIPTRDADTWGAGYYFNHLQDLSLGPVDLDSSAKGFEVYYDIAVTNSVSLTLDVQWIESAFPSVDDATILGARLNVSF